MEGCSDSGPSGSSSAIHGWRLTCECLGRGLMIVSVVLVDRGVARYMGGSN